MKEPRRSQVSGKAALFWVVAIVILWLSATTVAWYRKHQTEHPGEQFTLKDWKPYPP